MDLKTFENLPAEKKQSILSAGILCFGQYGYEKASISEIAREANVSKAAIFHYFGSKQDLFIYLGRYACEEITGALADGTEDYFESLQIALQIQLQLIQKHPGLYEFLQMTREIKDTELLEVMLSINKEHVEPNAFKVFTHVDWSRFRDEYDRATILNITKWVGDGCMLQFDKTLSLDATIAELLRYLAILKTALYKPEYL